MIPFRWLFHALLALCFLAGSASAQEAASVRFSPGTNGGYPEGIAWDASSGTFLVSSLSTGRIGRVAPDGTFTLFSNHPALITTSGILVGAPRNRVWVCNEDVGVGKGTSPATRTRLAQVFEFRLDTGELQQIHDFAPLSSGATLANDLTMDAVGNVYVTDSFQPVIYKIDGLTNAVSVFLRADPLTPAETAAAVGTRPYLNGIVYHPDGFLLVGDYTRGLLWKVPLDAPERFTAVQLPQRLKGPDGLLLRSPEELIAVQSFPDSERGMSGDVTLLRSADGWRSAQVAAVATPAELDGPTTATLKNGEVWITNSSFPRLFADPSQADQTTSFTLVRVPLKGAPALPER